MSGEKTEALLTRQTDYSESSRVVRLFTRDFGMISAIAKGGRRLKGPFDAALDLLAHSHIVFLRKSSGGLDILTEAQLISRFTPNPKRIKTLYGGYYVAELLNHFIEEHDPYPDLFDVAVRTLRDLSSDRRMDVVLLRFELNTLRQLGHLPAFDECVRCRSTIESQTGPSAFWVSQGGLLCANCRKPEYSTSIIQPGTIVVMRHLAESSSLTDRLAVSPQQRRELRGLTTSVISYLMGRRPKMARYLDL
ncbi:MAG: DNA repair protein RecO [Planctomycetaceae bacterium]